MLMKSLLPGDTPSLSDGEYCFDDFVQNGEIELALNCLVYMAESNIDVGLSVEMRFWEIAKNVCNELCSSADETTYSEVISYCCDCIMHHLNGKGAAN
jgi:hypothetical protein